MRFLLVEDDLVKANTIQRAVVGHEVDHYGSLRSGILALLDNPYDGVFLDMGFPMFDDGHGLKSDRGLDFLREMDRKNIDIPVCVISSNVFDVSAFANVKKYIAFDYQVDHSKEIQRFIDALSSET